MRIGIDIRAGQLTFGGRGIGSYIRELVWSLSRYLPQNEYVLIAFDDLKIPEWAATLPQCVRIAHIANHRLPENHISLRVPRLKLWRIYYELKEREHSRQLDRLIQKERLDLIHLPSLVDLSFFAGSRLRCPTVGSLLDLMPFILQDHFEREMRVPEFWLYRTQLESARRMDQVVAISRATAKDGIRILGLDPERVAVVPCAIAESCAKVTDAAILEECFTRHDIKAPYFLFCSGGGYNKNCERVIDAFAHFLQKKGGGYQLVISGPRTPSENRALKAQAFDLGLSSRQCIFSGHVSNEDLMAFFSGAMALLTPSIYEGFGLPAAEALKIGLPVIASDRSSHPEVVDNAGLQVDPFDTPAIVTALEQIAGQPRFREELAERGRIRAQLFTPERQALGLWQVYQAVGKSRTQRGTSKENGSESTRERENSKF